MPGIYIQKNKKIKNLPEFTENPDRINTYLSDESSAFRGSAEKVFFPRTAQEVSAILAEATRLGKKVTVSAGGTSITGSRVPMGGGWVLSVEKIRDPLADSIPEGWEILSMKDFSIAVSPDRTNALVPAGVRLDELSAILDRFNVFYPPDPTEMSAMLGGTIATNASGARSFLYGPTRKWVDGLEIVLPQGGIIFFRRGQIKFSGRQSSFDDGAGGEIEFSFSELYPFFDIKNAAGLYLRENMDLVEIFIGDEGLLGVVTQAFVKLTNKPGDIANFISFFGKTDDALDFGDSLRNGDFGFNPLSLEFFDRGALSLMREEYLEIPKDAVAAISYEFEFSRTAKHNPYPDNELTGKLVRALAQHVNIANWAAVGSDIAKMKKFRHALPEAVNKYVRARCGKLGTDFAVPPEKFRKLFNAYERAGDCGVKTVLFGHLGDYHLHLNFLPEDKKELEVARRKYLELAKFAASLGGTISAEHGIGKKSFKDENGRSVPYLEIMLGEENLKVIDRIKKVFDPANILNVGNMVGAHAKN